MDGRVRCFLFPPARASLATTLLRFKGRPLSAMSSGRVSGRMERAFAVRGCRRVHVRSCCLAYCYFLAASLLQSCKRNFCLHILQASPPIKHPEKQGQEAGLT